MGGVREREDSEGGKKGGREREREMIERRERDEREREIMFDTGDLASCPELVDS